MFIWIFVLKPNISETQEIPVVPVKVATTTKATKVPYILSEIGRCESGNKQFNPDGTVKRGIVNPQDVGKYQINEFYHLEDSRKLKMDIYTEEGNTQYAIHLYKTQGTTPWNWSKHCWGGAIKTNEIKK